MNWGASNFSPMVDHIALALLIISSLLVFTVFAAMVYFCVKYRKNSSARRDHPIEKPRKWEFGISAVIFIFGLSIFIWSSMVYYQMYKPPAKAREIYVVAKQWMWIFRGPDGQEQINKLQVPLGVPVRLIMTSEDVIHSFYIPDFRLKQDLVPGIYTSLWFKAEKTGTFPILCAEYCGLDHSQMRGEIEVVPAENSQSFSKNSASSLAQTGKKLFESKGCISCHSSDHPIGPSLANLFGRKITLTSGKTLTADENYVRRSILKPQADVVKGFQPVMPTFQGQLSEAELNALIAYLKEKKE